MGKAAKTRRADFRKKAKRSEKERQKALYESYKKLGQNKKDKKRGNAAKSDLVRTVRHVISNCGNVGCEKCFPGLRRPRMNEKPIR